MKQILLLPYGSHGDVFPFIWLGRRLRERGHRVAMIGCDKYARRAEEAGIDFSPLCSTVMDEMQADPRMAGRFTAARLAYSYFGRVAQDMVQAAEAWMAEHGRPDLILGQKSCHGGRLLREKHRIPMVTTHVFPLSLPSAYDLPLLMPAFRWLRKLPLALRKLVLAIPHPFDRYALESLRPLCRQHGVTPPTNLEHDWGRSPDGVLVMFPEWFAKPQPDWPAEVFQWHFPLEAVENSPLPADLARFVQSGRKTLLFTPGTGSPLARRFFTEAAPVVRELGCQAVFATSDSASLPPDLPAFIHASAYVPFGVLLPHVHALVHAGGVGTAALAFASGTPQLVTPMYHDQFDNADRVERLGAGVSLCFHQVNAQRLRERLQRCLQDKTIRQNASAMARRMSDAPPAAKLLEWIESRMPS